MTEVVTTMPIEYKVSPDKDQAKAAATAKLNEVLKSASNSPVLLLLSGGSALELLEGVDVLNLGKNVTLTVLDERYSEKDDENNFAQVAKTDFYKKAKNAGVQEIDTRVKGKTQEQLANEFNQALNEWTKNNPNGKIIATVGMGEDGHTSGMMPYPENPEAFKEAFDNGKEGLFVTAYNAGDKNKYPQRVTTNANFMRKINTAIAFITGETKKTAFDKLKAEEGSLAAAPIRILREIPTGVTVFTDIKA